MKIRTITCHDVYNYGASLQAYALQHFLSSQKHDVKIIDYKPQYLNRTYNFWYVSEKSRFYKQTKKNPFLHLLYSIWNIQHTYATWGRIYPFKHFKKKYLTCTNTYHTTKELQKNPPQADLYIAGSDQIWNTILPNGKDPAFYLNFGPSTTKKISYAASFGIERLDDTLRNNVKEYLTQIDEISVREKTGLQILQELGFKGTEVLDPVFLIDKDNWVNTFALSKRIIKEKYILVYDIFQDNKTLIQKAKLLSAKYNLKIIAINDSKKTPYAEINISNGGPIEFLNLIFNAEIIISCSFHATAFSIIFNKSFYVFYNKENISRMRDFLCGINLLDRLNPESLDSTINWGKVNDLLIKKITISKNFLLDAIDICK